MIIKGLNGCAKKGVSFLQLPADQIREIFQEASAANIKGFNPKTKVMIACDMSGSMQSSLSTNGKVQYYEVGNMLAMLLQSRCEHVISGIFGDEWKVTNFSQKGILSNTDNIRKRIGEVGYGTDGGKPLDWLIHGDYPVDKVLYFTDCQFWGESQYDKYFVNLWDTYKKISPDAHLYIFDLAGYGHSPIEMPRKDVTLIAGWSDRIFEMLDNIENGQTIIETISDKIDL